MNKHTARKILEIKAGATPAEIKRAFRKAAMAHHPDRGGDEETFKKIKDAYEFLTNEQSSVRKMSLSELLDTHGEDLAGNKIELIELTLEEAFTGVQVDAEPERGWLYAQSFTVEPGCYPADLVKCVEVGETEHHMYVSIKSNTYSIDFGEDGELTCGDIKRELRVSPLKMIIGGWETVELIDGKRTQVRIPPGLEANKILKIKGAGYWKNNKCHDRGNCFLRVIPDIKKITEYSRQEMGEFIIASGINVELPPFYKAQHDYFGI